MVKGIAKRIVVVRFPDARVFEQAIFIVREDAAMRTGVSAEQVLGEACRVAEGYMQRNTKPHRLRKMFPTLYVVAGALLMGLAWLGTLLLR